MSCHSLEKNHGFTINLQFSLGYTGYYWDGSRYHSVSWQPQLPQHPVCSLRLGFQHHSCHLIIKKRARRCGESPLCCSHFHRCYPTRHRFRGLLILGLARFFNRAESHITLKSQFSVFPTSLQAYQRHQQLMNHFPLRLQFRLRPAHDHRGVLHQSYL